MAASLCIAFWLLCSLTVPLVSSFYLHCPPCDPAACAEPACDVDGGLRYLDECGCCIKCYRTVGERCGGMTDYRCEPGFSCKYRLGLVVGEERTGVCEADFCVRELCGYRRFCVEHHNLGIRCTCMIHECDGKDNPVCGYDGNTYPSICRLQQIECRDDIFIGLRHLGRCPIYSDPPAAPASIAFRTNSPSAQENNDFFQDQLGQQPQQQPTSGCLYKNYRYNHNEMVLADQRDPCRYFLCTENDILSEIIVPGCQGGPVEVDYHVGERVVHGGWTPFSPWTECEGTCANGTRSRNHSCTDPAPQYEGRQCSGVEVEVERCIPQSCNLSCTYTEWSEWSPCLVSCGGGVSTRNRSLLYEVPFEELCELEQQESCAPDVCINGECDMHTKFEYLVNARACRTIWPVPVPYCAGSCEKSDKFCCQPKRYRVRNFAVECPGEDVWRDVPFSVIVKCKCKHCSQQLTG